jgi:MFS transporter, LPLT family, lysophospholipid transporter
VLGLLVAAIASAPAWPNAVPLLVLIGAVGGVLVVPLNALLQHRGHVLLSAGRSIAVQGFNENLSTLGMLGGYALLLALGADIVALMWFFGLAIAAAIGALALRERGRAGALAAGEATR